MSRDIVEDAKAWLETRDNETLRTHSENCHQWHTECLVARLVAEVDVLRAYLDRTAPPAEI